MSDAREGDKILATKGDSTIGGIVGDSGFIPNTGWYVKDLEEEGWQVEIVERKLPTQPGIYSVGLEDTGILRLRRLVLTERKLWYWLDFTAAKSESILEPVSNGYVEKNAHKLNLVYGGA